MMDENRSNRLNQIVTLCDQKEYELANKMLQEYLNDSKADYHEYLLMVRILTQDYEKKDVYEDFESYFQKALMTIPEDIKKETIQKYNHYIEQIEYENRFNQLMPKASKRTFSSNFIVFLISICVVVGSCLLLANQLTSGLIMLGAGIILCIIAYFLHVLKK